MSMVDHVHYNIVTSRMIASQLVLLALGIASVGKSISCVKNVNLVVKVHFIEIHVHNYLKFITAYHEVKL
jgi:hypothetical protein